VKISRKLAFIGIPALAIILAACGGGSAPPIPSQTASSGAIVKPIASGAPASPGGATAQASPKPAASASVSSSNAGVTPSPVEGKPQFQADAQHTGRSPYAGPRQLKLVRAFQMPLPDQPADPSMDIQSDPAIGPDGTIYISNYPGELLALADGPNNTLAFKWRFHPAGQSAEHATPAISRDGSVVLGFGTINDPQPALYDLKAAANGSQPQVAWHYDMGAIRITSSPAIGPDGSIYAVRGDGKLVVLDPGGALKWSAQTGPALRAGPALGANGMVYQASLDGNLYAVAPPEGGGKVDTSCFRLDCAGAQARRHAGDFHARWRHPRLIGMRPAASSAI